MHEEVVLMTTKGEAIAIGIAQMSTVELSTCDHGVVAKVKRCIMERDLYPRRWGMGPVALEKKKLKSDGKLDKYGRANEQTPSNWNDKYTDYNAPLNANGTPAAPTSETTSKADVLSAPPVAPTGEIVAPDTPASKSAMEVDTPATDKKRKHEGETPEERKARKEAKKAKKEAKKAKKAKKGGKDSDSDSD